jgi:tetratricopeptide (TPR) repeat protein
MHELAAQFDDRRSQAPVCDSVGNAALADGRLTEAREAWLKLTELDHEHVPEFRYRTAHAALWNRDVAAMRDDLAAIEATGVHGNVVDARRVTIEGGIAALEGRRAEALSLYRDAIQKWRDLRQPWDEALTVIGAATVLGVDDPEIRRAAAQTREFLVRVRAAPFVQRLDAAIEHSARSEKTGEPPPVARMTEAAPQPEEATSPGG